VKTLLEMRTEVIEDLDLQDSDLINDTDIDRWINKGIKIAQSEILGIHEPYFLSYDEVSIISGTDIYDYPSDIYANKVKSLILVRNSTETYKISRIDDMDKASSIQVLYANTLSNGGGGWVPLNTASNGRKIQLIPVPQSGTLKVWYIRNAKTLVLDTDVCDIDEFEDYIIAYAKMRALQKDSNPMFAEAKSEEIEYKRLMIETLTDMVLDNSDNKLPADMSFYESED